MAVPSILTICVNYHNDEQTLRFVRQLLGQKCLCDQKVVIVDNSETPVAEGALWDEAGTNERICLYHPGKNLGYYGGAAWGLREYTKKFPLPDWVIVCNTDMQFVRADFLSNLCALYSTSEHAVVAPAIISGASGRDLNPFMKERPTRARMHFYKWAFRYYPLLMTYQVLGLVKNKIQFMSTFAGPRSKASSEEKVRLPQQIYAPHASFVIYNRKYFTCGGTLDYSVFLYGEEIFIAETVKRLGLTILYDPRLEVLHLQHATTNIFKSRRIPNFMKEAAEYCADTFF